MLRFLFALALAFPALLAPLAAQVYTIQPRPMQVDNKPRGGFSLSFRHGGATNVRFEDVGTIASFRDIGDTTSNVGRSYDDGFVGPDNRGSSGVLDDGRTNRWQYIFANQLLGPDNETVEFHRHSTTTSGQDVNIDGGALAGIDMQYDMVLGVMGSKVTDKAWTFTWGAMASGVFSAINAKTNASITANLLTTTDRYTSEGAVIPTGGYSAPSTRTIDGLTVDTSILLNNRPLSRSADVLTPDGATIEGFWQVKGAYYTLRAGPWMRWQLGRRLSFRASVGAAFSFLGAKLEYDEFVTSLDEIVGIIRAGETTTADKNERFGYFGALDAEFWLTERTGFFAGVTVEDNGEDMVLRSNGGRRAVVALPSGTGFRAGISVLF